MSYVEIPLVRLALAALLILVSVALSRWQKIGLERDLIFGALRAAVQLIAIGYALVFIFALDSPWLVLLALAVMLTVASWTTARRVSRGRLWRQLLPRAFLAIGLGGAVALLPVLVWIIPVRPVWSPQYAIPISGMVLASGMNVATLVLDRIVSGSQQSAAVIEQALALGATPSQALAPMRKKAVHTAMLPTINALLTLGLVQLPGMMTGQILSGVSPLQAVRYQLVIMYQLVAVAAVAGILAAFFVQGVLFDDGGRLRRFGES